MEVEGFDLARETSKHDISIWSALKRRFMILRL